MSVDTCQRRYDWDDPTPTALAGIDRCGLHVLQAIGTGALPLPPAVKTLVAASGQVSFSLQPSEFHHNPFELVHRRARRHDGHSDGLRRPLTAPGGRRVRHERVERPFVRPALLGPGSLVCAGEVVHQGKSTMIASARIVDVDKRVIAIAGATCLIRRG